MLLANATYAGAGVSSVAGIYVAIEPWNCRSA